MSYLWKKVTVTGRGATHEKKHLNKYINLPSCLNSYEQFKEPTGDQAIFHQNGREACSLKKQPSQEHPEPSFATPGVNICPEDRWFD